MARAEPMEARRDAAAREPSSSSEPKNESEEMPLDVAYLLKAPAPLEAEEAGARVAPVPAAGALDVAPVMLFMPPSST
jgi:hypothetical protein